MKFRSLSRNYFKKIYKEDIYGYTEKRFIPLIKKYMAGIKGPVLDAGCGFENPYLESLQFNHLVGADIDPCVVVKNKLHREFIIQDLHNLQTEQQFEGIISFYTWEHLQNPELVLKNFMRLLKEQGIICIIASQRYHYLSLAARLFSSRLKDLTWKLLKGYGYKPFPAYFRFCSKKSIASGARLLNLKFEHFSAIEGPPLWFCAIPPLFILGCFYMELINKFKFFESLRGTFIAVLRKT